MYAPKIQREHFKLRQVLKVVWKRIFSRWMFWITSYQNPNRRKRTGVKFKRIKRAKNVLKVASRTNTISSEEDLDHKGFRRFYDPIFIGLKDYLRFINPSPLPFSPQFPSPKGDSYGWWWLSQSLCGYPW